MKFNEINAPVQPDTYEASMLIKQSIRAGKYSIQIHNLLDNNQEVEAWVQQKIELATNYVKKIAKNLELEGQYSEDAGEGHMAKSQLFHSARYAMQIAQTVRPGDDIEAWVQTKMNRAVDMLDAVYHYEDYQRLNPYREDLGDEHAKHGAIIQKKIDEILAYETEIDDIETKPGMFNILKKRVNEFEKKMTKSKVDAQTESVDVNESPRARGRALANLKYAKAIANDIIQGKDPMSLKAKAQAFLGSVDETIRELDKMYETTTESQLDEGIKEWAKRLAMAGVVVAGLAGIGSINDAINNSVPAIKAMHTALEMAQDSGNDTLAQMIEKDIRDAKVRLDSGRDLPYVKDLQDKYAKFMVKENNYADTDTLQKMSDYDAKKRTIQDLQLDPNTSKDTELKNKLVSRLKQLQKTKA